MDELFLKMSTEFELTHTKIINNSIQVEKLDESILIMSKQQLITSYEHMTCGVLRNLPISFINKWVICNDEISKKDSMEIYPDDSKCPENVYNLWRPFAMELLTEPFDQTLYSEELKILLNHIFNLCNKEKLVYN